jgi:hypothetical protein
MMSNDYDFTPEKPTVGKRLRNSKTFWANLIAGGGTVLTMLLNSDIVQNNPQYAAYATTALAVVNILLRLTTKEPVKGV